MHVVQINFFIDPLRRSPAALLRAWPSLAAVAAAARSATERVTVVQASLVAGEIVQAGVTFHFVSPATASALLTRSAAFRALIHELEADVFHVHGLSFGREVHELHELDRGTPILLQDHADRVPRLWRRATWRRGVAAARGMSFCARAQAEPFRRARLLPPSMDIFELPESTSAFVPGDKATARAATGLRGDPAVLWVGHLNDNKDPLTALEGVRAATPDLPNLQLWCCYAAAPLLSAVETRVARDAALRDRVHLLGSTPHERIELMMRAADLFVLASRREGGNFALIEAMAAGLTPIVSDIPSSRALTGNGSVGALWPCGDSRALSVALRRCAVNAGPRVRARVRAHFDEHLSSAALGRSLAAAYGRLVAHGSAAPACVAAS